MISLFIWLIYGVFVGSIAKAIVPGEERMGFFQTVALGVAGSYTGGAICYLLGMANGLAPSGILFGIGGAVLALVLCNKLQKR